MEVIGNDRHEVEGHLKSQSGVSAGVYSSKDVFSGGMNHGSPSGSPIRPVWVWYLSDCNAPNVKFGGGKLANCTAPSMPRLSGWGLCHRATPQEDDTTRIPFPHHTWNRHRLTAVTGFSTQDCQHVGYQKLQTSPFFPKIIKKFRFV